MNNPAVERLTKLRALMKERQIDAYLINGADPHLSEYVPARWQTREYISGFSGSYGWLAITANKAVLWTDSRYYVQAQQQLLNSGVEMLKARVADSPSLDQWLCAELIENQIVAFDGYCYSASEINQLKEKLAKHKIQLNPTVDLINEIWDNRPNIPTQKAFLHPIEFAGIGRKEKFEQIAQHLHTTNADYLIVTALDEVCWTFNIRGNDVDFNPVALSYGIVGKDKAELFIDKDKLSENDVNELIGDGVTITDYANFFQEIGEIAKKSVFIDPDKTNYQIKKELSKKNLIVEGTSAVAILKSCKNSVEIAGMRKAAITDALALLNFQLWLEKALNEGVVTEYDVAQKLMEFRSEQDGYIGASFFPIVGYRDHGAIVHFRVTPETEHRIEKKGILLTDSGGQYKYGTTDITRTFALGEVEQLVKTDFTLVQKGMIALSNTVFPKGTIGCHLDVLARKALWEHGLNYGHGTGHGVGAFMNVHEGPGSIRPDLNSQPIRVGNIFSNEPGLYREGEYGIRTENLLLCVPHQSTPFGEFLRFETLTYYPIDMQLVDKNLLSTDEIEWLNNYHQAIYKQLEPLVNEEQKKLLCRLTQAI